MPLAFRRPPSSVASLYFGVDAALVVACQAVRQLLVLVVVPLVFARIPPGRRFGEE
jgi:uncharacterized membrane protein AbrB (regulator of aidB expression)